jgi:twitching motility protein PilT
LSASLAHLRWVDALHLGRRRDASDIHVVPERAPAIRVDGELQYLAGSPLSPEDVTHIAGAFFEESMLARIERGEDVSVTQTAEDASSILRAHGYRTARGLALAVRLLAREVPTLESLHLPPAIDALAQRERGLVLFAGPTGSGKSTSLAAVVDAINATSPRRIITIEDPIEYRYESKRAMITQREIGRDATSYAQALSGALRSDPDVIVVGEMRDAATMRAALTAAETGHLVLTTVHTGSAVQTIERIVDAFSGVEQSQVRAQLAQTLSAVVCQRLVRRKAGTGRRAIAEILLVNDAVRAMIRESRTHLIGNTIATGRGTGMQSFEAHLEELALAGEV